MRYDQLEHAIRAACDVSGDTELPIFGSQDYGDTLLNCLLRSGLHFTQPPIELFL